MESTETQTRYNQERIDAFSVIYKSKLKAEVEANPTRYATAPGNSDELADRMLNSIVTKGIHSVILSKPMIQTAKELKIKPNYRAIQSYLRGEEVL